MRFSNITADLHSVVNWAQMEDLRQIKLLGDRSIEVLKGIRAAGVDDYISCSEIQRVMEIHVGKKYASKSSNIKVALQKCGNRVEKQLVDGRLRFRFPMTKAPSLD